MLFNEYFKLQQIETVEKTIISVNMCVECDTPPILTHIRYPILIGADWHESGASYTQCKRQGLQLS